ncbi:MAG: PKD domain-containing protein [Bacteroidia bacterium]|nr:PKD domain-containing protein [Bacteroidia bacterium]
MSGFIRLSLLMMFALGTVRVLAQQTVVSVTPNTACIGDTVVIRTTGFSGFDSGNPPNVSVINGGSTAPMAVVSFNNSAPSNSREITVIVPSITVSGNDDVVDVRVQRGGTGQLDTLLQGLTIRNTPRVLALRDTTLCQGASVTFAGTLFPNTGVAPVTYAWLPAGGTQTGSNYQLTPAAGTSNVIVTATGANGCLDKDTAVVVTRLAPSLSGTPVITSPCPGQTNGTVTLSVQGSAGITLQTQITPTVDAAYVNGSTRNNVSVPPGTYSLRIRYNNDPRCETTLANIITVNAPPTWSADITSPASVPSICTGETVSFQSAAAAGVAISWNFGTGASPATASGAGPHVVTYTNSTSADVTATAVVTYTGGGCTDTDQINVTVKYRPLADIIAPNPLPASVCKGTSLDFEAAEAPGSGETYSWVFGNGQTSTNRNPGAQTYTTLGSTAATLTVSKNGCVSTETASFTVINTPTASFALPASPVCAGAPAVFQTSSVQGETYSWNFGANASPATASGAGPHSIPYSAAGNKSVRLTVSASGCSDDTTIVLSVKAKPTVSITASVSGEVCENQVFGVSATSSIPNSAFVWAFGSDAFPVSSTNASDSLSYLAPGEQDIQVIANSSDGCADTATISLDVIDEEEAECRLFTVPDIFTPNGDGANDELVIGTRADIDADQFRIRIYNRSGGLVYNGLVSAFWDGAGAADGPYWYLITDLNNSADVRARGALSILRKL